MEMPVSENNDSDFDAIFGILFWCVLIGWIFGGTTLVVTSCIGGFIVISSTILLGGKIAGADDARFGMAVIATIATIVTNAISFSVMLSSSTLQSLEPLVGFILETFVVQGCFSTSFGKALVAVIMSWLISIILLAGLWFAFGKTLLPELMPLLLKLLANS